MSLQDIILAAKPSIVIWDFDGVIVDSDAIREDAFRHALRDFRTRYVDQLIKYHKDNGGLSRYDKFQFFNNEFANKTLDISKALLDFTLHCRKNLTNRSILSPICLSIVELLNSKGIKNIIASGSDNIELNEVVLKLGIKNSFVAVYGSPISKTHLVEGLTNHFGNNALLIGDSINDYHAAKVNKISFVGVNNKSLRNKISGKSALYCDEVIF